MEFNRLIIDLNVGDNGCNLPLGSDIAVQISKWRCRFEVGLLKQLMDFEWLDFLSSAIRLTLDNFAKFMKYARQYPVKILAGIVLLVSARMAKYMNKNVPGIMVPQNLIDEMAGAPKGEALNKGIEIAGRMIAELKKESLCDGVHIMAIGREEVVPDILAAAGINGRH